MEGFTHTSALGARHPETQAAAKSLWGVLNAKDQACLEWQGQQHGAQLASFGPQAWAAIASAPAVFAEPLDGSAPGP